MKILVVGSDKGFAIENIYIKYLQLAEMEVHRFPSRSIFFDYYQRSIVNKLLFRLGVSRIYNTINNQLKKTVIDFRPEVIWVFKGMEIFPETLEWLRQEGIKLVNYNADNPFIFSSNGSGNRNLTDSLHLYDLHLTYSQSVRNRIQEEFKIKTVLLPFGFDIEQSLVERCMLEPEISEVCFLGNPDKSRAKFIQALADKGIPMVVYGKDWNRFINHPGIKIHRPVHGEDLWRVLRKYRVQLNLVRVHNEDSHNMRTFEVPGVGGIMVAPNTSDHRLYFEDGQEVILFNELKDCVEKIRQTLNFPKERADEIRTAARKRSLESKYSYRDRTQQVINVLAQL